jgi:AraC-like DNA-binding protein
LGLVVLKSGRPGRLPRGFLSAYLFSNALLLAVFTGKQWLPFDLPEIPTFYFLLAPLLYLYIRTLCQHETSFDRTDFVHVLLFLAAILYTAGWLIFRDPESSLAESWNLYEYRLSQIFLLCQVATYVFLTFSQVLSYRKTYQEHSPSSGKVDLNWLLLLVSAFTLMWLSDVASFFLGEVGWIGARGFRLLAIVSVFINFVFATLLVYRGMKHSEVFSGLKDAPRYAANGLSEAENSEISERLKALMAGSKPFLNPDLTLKELSLMLKVQPRQLSQVINSTFRKNFSDFINQYRIDEARQLISDPAHSSKTILEILYQVGYNSKSAFNTAFKKQTGQTPTDYRKKLTGKS